MERPNSTRDEPGLTRSFIFPHCFPSLPTEDSSEATSSLPQDAAQLSSLPSGGMGLAAVQGGACNEKRISRQQLFHLPPGAPWTPLGAAQIFFGHSLGSERHKSACGRQ